MGAIADHAAVALMFLLMQWPLAAVAIAVPVVLALWRLRVGRWGDARPRRAARLAFAVGMVAGVLAAFAVIGGDPTDLSYWLDWLFLGILAIGTGGYVALLVYLGVPPASAGNG